MLRVILILLIVLPSAAGAVSLKQDDLIGTWVPSGEIPRSGSVAEYAFIIKPDMSAVYEGMDSGPSLGCKFKPSSSQNTIFVWYCYLKEKHLITLALGGWSSKSGALLYGYEYWLGHPEPGQLHGGLPVSLKSADL